MAGTRKKALTPKKTEPSEKQKRFVAEYLVDLNATQAAIRAGYSPRSAQEQSSVLLSKPILQELVQAGQKAKADALDVDAKWLLKRMIANHDRAMQAEPVLDREGNPTGEYTYNGTVANKALEMIGQHIGFFEKSLPKDGLLAMFKVYIDLDPSDI